MLEFGQYNLLVSFHYRLVFDYLSIFVTLFLKLHVDVCLPVWEHVHTSAGALEGQSWAWIPGVGVLGGSKPPSMGAGSLTQSPKAMQALKQ